MRDANLQKGARQKSWIATKSTARRSKGASDRTCEQLSLSCAHSVSTGAAFEAVAKATTVGPWRGSRRRTSKHALSGVDDGSSSTSALSAAVSSRRGLASLPGSARSLVGEPSLRTGVCVIKVPPPPAVYDTGGIFRGYGHKPRRRRPRCQARCLRCCNPQEDRS